MLTQFQLTLAQLQQSIADAATLPNNAAAIALATVVAALTAFTLTARTPANR